MRLVTKNIIRKIFQDIATAFYQINSFGYGPADEFVQKTMDEGDQELEGTIIYPRLYVTPEPSTITGKRINRNYTIVVADLVRKGRENMTEAESDTEQILTDVIAQIQDQEYGFILDVSNISIVPFTGRFVDEVTGHYAEVSLYSGFEFNRCQIPSEFISISSPYIPLDEEGTNERDPLSWHKTGNTLTASSTLGSNNDQDWRFIHNNVTLVTVTADGLEVDGVPLRPVRVFTIDAPVNTEITDARLIGGTLDGMTITHAGTEQITIDNIQSYDSITGTIIFVNDLGGVGAVKIMMIL